MKITTSEGDTKLLMKESLRDDVMSSKLPVNCGIPNTPAMIYIVGRPGSGKSLMVESLMGEQWSIGKGKETCFDSIWYFCPRTSQGSYKNSFMEDLDPDKTYEDLSPDNLWDVYNQIQDLNPPDLKDKWGRKVEPKYSCLIMDDVITEINSKAVKPIVARMSKNHRHLRVVIIIISQNYMLLEKNTRDCVSHLIQYNTTNLRERERINEEWVGWANNREFDEFWSYIFDKPYEFLIANRRTDEYHKTFNPITIEDIHSQPLKKNDEKKLKGSKSKTKKTIDKKEDEEEPR